MRLLDLGFVPLKARVFVEHGLARIRNLLLVSHFLIMGFTSVGGAKITDTLSTLR